MHLNLEFVNIYFTYLSFTKKSELPKFSCNSLNLILNYWMIFFLNFKIQDSALSHKWQTIDNSLKDITKMIKNSRLTSFLMSLSWSSAMLFIATNGCSLWKSWVGGVLAFQTVPKVPLPNFDIWWKDLHFRWHLWYE